MGKGKQEIAMGCISTGGEADIPCMGEGGDVVIFLKFTSFVIYLKFASRLLPDG